MERSAFEIVWVDYAHTDWNAVGKVEADRGDRRRAVERDGRAERRESKEEGTAGAEEDGTDWGVEATVDDVQSMRNAAVTGEGEHHARIGSLEGVSEFRDWDAQDYVSAVGKGWGGVRTKLKRPQCQTQSMIRTMSTNPPPSPHASIKIFSTGSGLVLTAWKS